MLPQGATVAPPVLVPGCGQGECCQHIGLLDLILAIHSALNSVAAHHLPPFDE